MFLLMFVGCLLFVVCCRFPPRFFLFAGRCALFAVVLRVVVCCWSFVIVCYSLCAFRCSLFVVCCLLSGVCCCCGLWFVVVCCGLLLLVC